MTTNKWMKQLLKHDRAVSFDYDPFTNVLRTGSPSFDYIYGNTHGLPFGYSEVLWGPPKGGKTFVTNCKIAQLHAMDPDAIALLYSTEMRAELQLNRRSMMKFGIDPDRIAVYNTNKPEDIFDHISGPVAAMCQGGAKIRYIVVDSTSDIVGRRTQDASSILQQQIGDEAKTLQDGLKQVKPVIRDHRIAVSLIAQARAEMDQLEQKRGNKLKMSGAWALKHFAEYFIYVEMNANKVAKVDLQGNAFIMDSMHDQLGENRAAAKHRVVMKGNSAGPAGRAGEFTLDYNTGITNIYEEAFLLGTAQGVVLKPNQQTYVVPDWPTKGEATTFRGKPDFITALKDNTYLTAEVLKRVRELDVIAMETGKPIHGLVEQAGTVPALEFNLSSE
ncbi:RecA-like recombination protein [Myxococcus phage Mx1]|nr:RecA-like recombination protein [Myxococcus phage Mx1]